MVGFVVGRPHSSRVDLDEGVVLLSPVVPKFWKQDIICIKVLVVVVATDRMVVMLAVHR